jgi:hypothetical protein
MKQFKENFEPIELELINKAGESFVIKSKFLTSAEANEVQKIMRDESVTLIDRCLKSMVIWFGENAEFYNQFSIELLTDVAKHMRDIKTKKK